MLVRVQTATGLGMGGGGEGIKIDQREVTAIGPEITSEPNLWLLNVR